MAVNKTDETKPVWQEIDTDTLPAEVAEAYDAYKDAYRVTKALRETFETKARDVVELPDGKRLAIAYNFGKLSFAAVDGEPAKAKRKNVVALSSFRAA